MHLPLAIALTLAVVVAGCASEGTALDATSATPTAPEAGTWNLKAEGTIGWIAAVGAHAFAADTVVGVRSHDQCPELSFALPAGASALRILVAPGNAPGTLAISGPGAVWYYSEALESTPEFEASDPAAGVWAVELKPNGALANEARALEVEIRGNGSAPAADLVLQADPDCLL